MTEKENEVVSIETKLAELNSFVFQELPEIIESAEELLTDEKKAKLLEYCQYLLEWNAKINLISRKSEVRVIKEGLVESLSLLEVMSDYAGDLLDIGSGGGFPGLILAIMNEELKITLMDSIKKKTMVLKDIAKSLGLTNVVVLNARMEEVLKDHRGTFDYITTRGVGKFGDYIPVYLEYINDFGNVFILTGEDYHKEKIFNEADILENPYISDRVIAIFSH